MKIYFIAAISQAKEYGDHYREIVEVLEKAGHKVKYDHVINRDLSKILQDSDKEKIDYYKKFLRWVNESDIVVAEASFPSTVHVGHEISVALEKGKPVVLLHRKTKDPVFLEGLESEKLFIQEYDDSNLRDILIDAVEYASEMQDVRFNFFVSPEIQQYLDWVAKYKRTPRAVYLRELLEKDMKENKDWKKQK